MKEKLIDKLNPLKDYVKDDKGNYIYKGKLYIPNLNKDEMSLLCKKLWIIIILAVIFWIVGGFLRFRGIMYSFPIVLMYCFEVINLLVIFRGVFVLSSNKTELKERDYKKSIENFPIFSIILIICCLISLVLSIIFVIKNSFNNDQLSFVIYLLSKIIIVVLIILFNREYKKLNYICKDLSVI